MTRDDLDGQALVLELAVEVLKLRRQKMLAMAEDILEARCPGIHRSLVNWTEEDVLCEAGEALKCITQDLEDAQEDLASFLAMRNAIVAINGIAQG